MYLSIDDQQRHAWFPITFVQCNGTFGSLTFRVIGGKLAEVGSPLWLGKRGSYMGVGL